MSITNKLNQIKNAIYGKEVRGAIHDAIKECYDDASVNHDNANMEVKMARGTHNTLNDRLDNVDEIQAQTNAQLSEVEKKIIKPQIVFTFDDGLAGDGTAAELLKEYGMVGCFALIGTNLYKTTSYSLNNYQALEKEGFEIMSHTMNHLDWRESSALNPTESELSYEYGQATEELRNRGFECRNIVVPFSQLKNSLYNQAKNYCDFILIGGTGLNDLKNIKDRKLSRINQYQIGLSGCKEHIDKAIQENKMLIFYDHEIGASGSMSKADFEELLQYVKDKVDKGLCEVNTVINATQRMFSYKYPQIQIGAIVDNFFDAFRKTSENNCTIEKSKSHYDDEIVDKVTIQPSSSNEDSIATTSFSVDSMKGNLGVVHVNYQIVGSNSHAIRYNFETVVRFETQEGEPLQTYTSKSHTLTQNKKYMSHTVHVNPGVDLNKIKRVSVSIRITNNQATEVVQYVDICQMVMGYGTIPVKANFNPNKKVFNKLETNELKATDVFTTFKTQRADNVDVNGADTIIVYGNGATDLTMPVVECAKKTVIFKDGNVTLRTTDFKLKGNADWNPTPLSSITLIYNKDLTSRWVEIARTEM